MASVWTYGGDLVGKQYSARKKRDWSRHPVGDQNDPIPKTAEKIGKEQEIADAVGVTKETISQRMKVCQDLTQVSKSDKLSAMFEDEIAEEVGLSKAEVNTRVNECLELDKCPKVNKLSAMF